MSTRVVDFCVLMLFARFVFVVRAPWFRGASNGGFDRYGVARRREDEVAYERDFYITWSPTAMMYQYWAWSFQAPNMLRCHLFLLIRTH